MYISGNNKIFALCDPEMRIREKAGEAQQDEVPGSKEETGDWIVIDDVKIPVQKNAETAG